MKLEDQLAALRELGIALDPGITLERDGAKFRAKDNGQAMVLYYLPDASARRLSQLAGEKLTTVTDPD